MKKSIAALFIGIILAGLGGLSVQGLSPHVQNSQVAVILHAQFSTEQLTGKADPTMSATLPPTASSTPISTADWQTYTDSDHGFSIKYPLTMELKSGKELYDNSHGNGGILCNIWPDQHEETLVCFFLPEGTYPETTNTDFSRASVAVSVVTVDQQNCLSFRDVHIPEFQRVKRVVINGIEFSSTKRSGAAAGTRGTFAYYRTFVHNICFDFTTTLVTVARYENSVWTSTPMVKPFTEANEQKIQAIFDQMLLTLSFAPSEQ